MKRIVLAAIILGTGSSIFYALQHSTVQVREQIAARHADWSAQTNLLKQTQVQHTQLTMRIRELKESRLNQPQTTVRSELLDWAASTASNRLSPQVRETLLAELGFEWNSMADYLVISKESLRNVGIEVLRENRLTDTACGILAITP